MKTLVIIPAYNEGKKIYEVARGVLELGYDVVVVDDGSRDNTAAEARRAGAGRLRHFINRGYGAALATGNEYALRAGYDIVVHFDADGQFDPHEIKDLVAPIESGEYGVALGSRFIKRGEKKGVKGEEGMPAVRRVLLKIGIWFTWFVSGVKLTDTHNGFRAFARYSLQKIDCRQNGMSYASEIIDQIGEHCLKIKEAPVTVRYTDYSRAKGENNFKKILLGFSFLWGKFIK